MDQVGQSFLEYGLAGLLLFISLWFNYEQYKYNKVLVEKLENLVLKNIHVIEENNNVLNIKKLFDSIKSRGEEI